MYVNDEIVRKMTNNTTPAQMIVDYLLKLKKKSVYVTNDHVRI
jgi:hypothetical protein